MRKSITFFDKVHGRWFTDTYDWADRNGPSAHNPYVRVSATPRPATA